MLLGERFLVVVVAVVPVAVAVVVEVVVIVVAVVDVVVAAGNTYLLFPLDILSILPEKQPTLLLELHIFLLIR